MGEQPNQRRLAAILAARYRRVFPPDERGRGSNGQCLASGAGRGHSAVHRGILGAHRQAHRRRVSRRISDRERGGALRRHHATRIRGVKRRHSRSPADEFPHGHQPGRNHRRRRRHSWRWSQYRGAPGGAGGSTVHLCHVVGLRPGSKKGRLYVRGHGRTSRKEHRRTDPRIQDSVRRADQTRRRGGRIGALDGRQTIDRRPSIRQHERRSRTGILRRRADRGYPHPVVPLQGPVRDLAQLDLHLQRPGGEGARGGPRPWRRLCGRGAACARRASAYA